MHTIEPADYLMDIEGLGRPSSTARLSTTEYPGPVLAREETKCCTVVAGPHLRSAGLPNDQPSVLSIA